MWRSGLNTAGIGASLRYALNPVTDCSSVSTLSYTARHLTPLNNSKVHLITLHYTILYYTKLHYTILHYTTLHYTKLHYTKLYYTTPADHRV